MLNLFMHLRKNKKENKTLPFLLEEDSWIIAVSKVISTAFHSLEVRT